MFETQYHRNEDNRMDTERFGKKIAALRREKGLTQAKLAEQLSVSNKAVSRWETGEGYPEISLLKPLAKALGTTVDDLLSDENEAEKEDTVSREEKKAESFFGRMKDDREEISVDMKAFRTLHWGKFLGSLTIFNKIAFFTLAGSVVLLIGGFILSIINPEIPLNISLSIYLGILGNAGIFSSLLGLVLDLLGYGKKQTKGHIVFLAICVAGRYLFQYLAILVLMMGFSIL